MQWYRSLYWRIALGFVLCLAALLVVQAILFVWVASWTGPTIPGQAPERFAQNIARDLADELSDSPDLDLPGYVARHYGGAAHPFFVMLADGRVLTNSGGSVPPELLEEARLRLRVRAPAVRRAERLPRPFRPLPFRQSRTAPIVVASGVAGVVVVPPQAGFGFLFRRYAPTLSVVALSTLLVGGLLTAILVFGPARRRLRAVEDAARRLGKGDLSARVPAQGGDEVAAVAAAFNQMAGDLAASDRARRQLLADVSHELTTPVTAIRGYLETLSMPDLTGNDEARARYLTIIGDETQRLERIIGDLLDLARLEGGGGALNQAAVPVEQLFARVAARHGREFEKVGVRLFTAVDPEAAVVHGDRDRIEQALQNLAANALRYAPAGSTVELAARRDGPAVVLSVTDEGPGIAPEHLPRVFDRFYKADPARASRGDAAGGSGLGLSIVKAIVERHGGTVSVSSRPGRTRFELRIGN